MKREALLLGRHRSLVTLVTTPDDPAPTVAAIFLNAGLMHRVGPGGVYVKLAAALAERGIMSARFDYSGVGDSPPRPDHLPIAEMAETEPIDIMDDLAARFGVRRFVLLGICSGAYGAFRAALADPRVIGSVLINPEQLGYGQDLIEQARDRRYFRRSIFRWTAWRNLLTGHADLGRLHQALRRIVAWPMSGNIGRVDEARHQMIDDITRLTGRGARLLFVTSELDVASVFIESVLRDTPQGVQHIDLPDADHLLTTVGQQQQLIDRVLEWIESS